MEIYKYLATFISGLQAPIEDVLISSLKDCKITLMLDGAVVFETSCSYDRLGLHCCNNIFALIDMAKAKNGNSVQAYMQNIVKRNVHSAIISDNNAKIRTFRIITSAENQLIPVSNIVKCAVEKHIMRQSNLSVDRGISDTEFWFLYRNEGYCFFMKRLSRHMSYDKLLHKGELHPELAYMLNYISHPEKNNICLDPFCGYGSIPVQGLQHFPTNTFYAFDIDTSAMRNVQKSISPGLLPKLLVKKVDIRNIENELPAESIDRIVTDPPWGLYEKIEEGAQQFYGMFIAKLSKLLKPAGRMVILSAKKDECERAISAVPCLKTEAVYNILVSGKKSGIYCVSKDFVTSS
ncbi:MAG: methyltransferase [Treponema sp.]|nr:methyltransferase [Treponema sp.]